mmetsp:Transcript_15123/g.26960  ORF Transcript_15123/g.26960 Transcript_15123/m.26960 type:complete len:327 (+) Transcript_15123:183-1163(+)
MSHVREDDATLGEKLRTAARDNKLGNLDSVYKSSPQSDFTLDQVKERAEDWAKAIEELLESAESQYERVSRPFETINSEDTQYFLIKVEYTGEAEVEGFGEADSDDGEVFKQSHSTICCSTGEIYGVTATQLPAISEGPRGNVFLEETFKKALQSNSGMLTLYGTTVAELVWSLRAPVDYPNSFGETALMQAAACGHAEMCKWLLQEGAASADAATKAGVTALLLATDRGSEECREVIRTLVQHGKANINCSNAWGKTPLHIAAFRGNLPMAKLLVDLGADPSLRDQKGNLAVFYASEEECFPGDDGEKNYDPELEAFLQDLSKAR